MAKTIKLTEDESRAYTKLKYLAHYDAATEENTYPDYGVKLKAWTEALRKKYNLKDTEAFFFTLHQPE